MSERVQVAIVGAGVIGCAVAYQISQFFEDIVVIEKNGSVKAENQTSRNSGVIHAGIYYPPEISPLKAQLCVRGNELLYQFCQRYDVPHERVGKLVMAATPDELPYLEDTIAIARRNGVPDIEILEPSAARELEPNVDCLKAVLFPCSGIVEPTQLVYQLYSLANQQGVFFLTGREVVNITPQDNGFQVELESDTQREVFETDWLINAAGLWSDDIARMLNPDFPFRIQSYRGEMMQFVHTRRPDIRHYGMNLYPVPMPLNSNGLREAIPFDQFRQAFRDGRILKTVGVHITPLLEVDNHTWKRSTIVSVGPASRHVKDRDDHSPPAFSKAHFHQQIIPIFPNLKIDDLYFYQMGTQAKLPGHFDWVIEQDRHYPQCIQLVGIDSPGLTSCLAIAEYVESLVRKAGGEV